MGVPKFYSWLRLKNRTFQGILQRNIPGKVSSLSIDLNGLLHRVAQTVFSYGEGYNKERAELIQTMSEEELYQDYYDSLGTGIFNLFTSVAPADYIILAVDGVAPMAKINQQRARRFISSGSDVFNPNLISPGTEFMIRIDKFLRSWIAENQKVLPPNVIYSSHLVPGEAEHKIFAFFRDNPLYGVHAVSGLDADLVILALTVPKTNFIILREDISDIVNVTNLKSFVEEKFNSPTAIDDFIFLTFFVGNDFLPNSPSMEDLSAALDKLMETYIKIGKPLTNNKELDYNVLKEILSLVPEQELLTELASSASAPILLNRSLIHTNVINKGSIKSVKKLDLRVYSRYWYRQSLGGRDLLKSAELLLGKEPFAVTPERILEMAAKYLQGLTWIWRYYQGKENLNIGWFYPYHYAPLLIDMVNSTPDDLEKTLATGNPLTYKYLNPLQQLLAILPLTSLGIVPRKLEEVAYTYLADDFPEKAIIEDKMNGASWHKIVLLPFLDEERLVISTPVFSKEKEEIYSAKNDLLLHTTYTQTNAPISKPTKTYPTKPKYSYPARNKNWSKKKPLM